jgi:hypothetical protein
LLSIVADTGEHVLQTIPNSTIPVAGNTPTPPDSITKHKTYKRSPHSRRNMTPTELCHARGGISTAGEKMLFLQLLPSFQSKGKGVNVDFARMAMEWNKQTTVQSPDDVKVSK